MVNDAGAGFDVEGAMKGRGLGLVSMRERLRSVGGTLKISAAPGRGVIVEARVPQLDATRTAGAPQSAATSDERATNTGRRTTAAGDERLPRRARAASNPRDSTRPGGPTRSPRTDRGLPSRVILAGHLDTVPIADNVPSRLSGGELHGCRFHYAPAPLLRCWS